MSESPVEEACTSIGSQPLLLLALTMLIVGSVRLAVSIGAQLLVLVQLGGVVPQLLVQLGGGVTVVVLQACCVVTLPLSRYSTFCVPSLYWNVTTEQLMLYWVVYWLMTVIWVLVHWVELEFGPLQSCVADWVEVADSEELFPWQAVPLLLLPVVVALPHDGVVDVCSQVVVVVVLAMAESALLSVAQPVLLAATLMVRVFNEEAPAVAVAVTPLQVDWDEDTTKAIS